MSVNNDVISTLFQNISDLLEVKGENLFRIRAYRNAARVIRGISETMAEMVEKGEDLTQIPGIGEDLAGKICEIVKTGTLSQLLELEDQMPTGIYDLLKIPGLGPKKIKILYEKLQVGNIEALQYAAEKHQIQNLPGFGKKTEENILKKIIERSEGPERIRRDIAEMIANDYVAYLKHSSDLIKICVCGSYRRGVETVGDIDILASCTETSDIMERFIEYGDIKEVLSKGDTRSAVLLRSGMQVDLRIVPEKSYGAALHYFTGSKAHNIAIRKLAQKKKIKINEYGVFKGDGTVTHSYVLFFFFS